MNARIGSVEVLEDRIAPAAVFVTYEDTDGDRVKITASKPGSTAPPLDTGDLTQLGSGQLSTLALTEAGFDGASIVFTVTKSAGGDGLAHVGFIDATGRDLDRVVVKGDLGRIIAGDAVTTDDPGLNLLQVRTIGTLGLLTQGGVGNLTSIITGKLGRLKLAGDFTGALLFIAGGADGQLGGVQIGGDLVGDASSDGRITSSGAMGDVRILGSVVGGIISASMMGNVRIGGDLIGGAGAGSGQIAGTVSMGDVSVGGGIIGGAGSTSGVVISSGGIGDVRIGGGVTGGVGASSGEIYGLGAIGNVRIGGDLTGNDGVLSGRVFAGSELGNVRIGGDVVGSASNTGQIGSFGAIASVRIGGDLIGGTGNYSGYVSGVGAIGSVRIGGDLIGGSTTAAGTLFDAGGIRTSERIASVTIGGSLIAGTYAGAGTLVRCGAIVADDDLGAVKIGGSIVGNSGTDALIIGRGQAVKPGAGFDTAIASLTVGGDVRYAKILAGFDFNQSPANADASIGPVKVGRDWTASDLVAGAQDSGLPGWGVGDTLQAVGNTGLIARIASITIRGDATGSYPIGDSFGFVAQQIDKLRIAGHAFALTPGPSSAGDNFLIFPTSDVRLLEVS